MKIKLFIKKIRNKKTRSALRAKKMTPSQKLGFKLNLFAEKLN